MLFLIFVLAQLIVVPLVAATLLHKDKVNKTAKENESRWQDVQLVDLPEGITTSSGGASRAKQRR